MKHEPTPTLEDRMAAWMAAEIALSVALREQARNLGQMGRELTGGR